MWERCFDGRTSIGARGFMSSVIRLTVEECEQQSVALGELHRWILVHLDASRSPDCATRFGCASVDRAQRYQPDVLVSVASFYSLLTCPPLSIGPTTG